MANPTLIAVNQTGSPISLKDLGGVVVPASSSINLTDTAGSRYPFSELQASEDLLTNINNDGILINDGNRLLSKTESLNYIRTVSTVNTTSVYVKNNVAATTNPVVSNDITEGYSINSVWVNTTTDVPYICLDSTTGAAVWKIMPSSLSQLTDVSITSPPPANGDSLVYVTGTGWTSTSGAGTNGSNNYIFSYDTTTQNAGSLHATGTVTLTGGASGSVNGITVNGVQIMSGAVAFDTDLTTTAFNVANNIAAFTSTPNYSAISNGSVITIYAVTASTGPNGFVVAANTTTITTNTTNMAGGTIITANVFAPVFFSDNAQISGWVHRVNTPIFRCVSTGQYAATVEFNVEKPGGGSPSVALVAKVNGTEILGSQHGMDITSNNTAFALSRTFLFNITAGQDLTVDFSSSLAIVQIVPAPEPTGTVTAIAGAIVIRRLT